MKDPTMVSCFECLTELLITCKENVLFNFNDCLSLFMNLIVKFDTLCFYRKKRCNIFVTVRLW